LDNGDGRPDRKDQRSLGQRDDRLPLSTAYVASSDAWPRPAFRTAWTTPAGDGQGVTGAARPRRLALDLVLQRPFDDVDDLFTRMGVLDRCRFEGYVDVLLDDLSSGSAEIVLLQFGAPQSRRLR
jgi:hypothetical protein